MAMDAESAESCMVGFYIKNTLSPHGNVARGFCDVVDGKLATVVERFEIGRRADGTIRYVEDGQEKEMADDDMVSMNLWGFSPRLFGFLERGFADFLARCGNEPKSEYLLPELIDGMIKNGETTVEVLSSSERWMGVTYPEDKPQVMAGIRELVERGVYPSNLWN
jgi:NDP-sugar pyrophosphorylase family protein